MSTPPRQPYRGVGVLGAEAFDQVNRNAWMEQQQRAAASAEAERRQQLEGRQADLVGAQELQRRNQVRDELYGMARGRAEEVRGDPMNAAILEELQRRVTGESQPFDDATRNALLSQQADMGDAALAAQMRQLGGRPGDPAYEAARRGAVLQGARGMQTAARDIDIRRSLENYAAQGTALSQAAGINQGINAGITDAERYIASLLGQEQFNVGMPTQEMSMADYLRMRGLA
jgi:hypothetical protein